MQQPVLNWRTGKLQKLRDQKNLPLPVFRTPMLRTRVIQPSYRSVTSLQQPVLVAQPLVAQSVFRTRLQQLKPLIAQRLVTQPRFRTLLPRARVLQPHYRSIISQLKPMLTSELTKLDDKDDEDDEVLCCSTFNILEWPFLPAPSRPSCPYSPPIPPPPFCFLRFIATVSKSRETSMN
jgi:hypothetical protein